MLLFYFFSDWAAAILEHCLDHGTLNSHELNKMKTDIAMTSLKRFDDITMTSLKKFDNVNSAKFGLHFLTFLQ